MRVVDRFVHDKSGAVAIEYALIASIISIAIVLAALGIGAKLEEMFSGFSGHFM